MTERIIKRFLKETMLETIISFSPKILGTQMQKEICVQNFECLKI